MNICGKKFVWGNVTKQHTIGEWLIVEYQDKNNNSETMFHPYYQGKDTGCSYATLDEALIGAISRKYDGLNTRADRYFLLGIGAIKHA